MLVAVVNLVNVLSLRLRRHVYNTLISGHELCGVDC